MSAYSNDNNGPSSVNQIIAGGLSGSVCRVLVQPFDVIKIRLQMQQYQLNKSKLHSKYNGILNCSYTLAREEGIRSLWKGHIAGQILSLMYGSSQFFVYNSILSIIKSYSSSNLSSKQESRNKLFTSFIAGGISGSISTLISYPFDLLRTRMVIQQKNEIYNSTLDAVIKLYKNEGFLAFYKGIYLSLIEVFATAGFQFAIYGFLKDILKPASYFSIKKDNLINSENRTNSEANFESILYGSFSGAFSRMITIPINTMKKRNQNKGFESNMGHLGSQEYFKINAYQWFLHAIKSDRTLKILFAGSTPAIVKSFVYSGALFYSYEKIIAIMCK